MFLVLMFLIFYCFILNILYTSVQWRAYCRTTISSNQSYSFGSIAPEESPPPYGEVCGDNSEHRGYIPRRSPSPSLSINSQIEDIRRAIADFDLLATCRDENVSKSPEKCTEQERWVPEVNASSAIEMGQKTSLLTGRHRSKVSLTWVLRERSDVQYNSCNSQILTDSSSSRRSTSDTFAKRYQKPNQNFERNLAIRDKEYYENENCYRDNANERIIGRNSKQRRSVGLENNNSRVFRTSKSASPNQHQNSWTDYVAGFENNPSAKRHKHRRRKRNTERHQQNFGYEITDIDCFLAEASIDNPGNIPVVVTYPSVLYQTRSGSQQKELYLSLGMVVNAVFKNQQWLYVQTPHGEEGYVLYASCLPLGILPSQHKSHNSWKAAPCWESTLDLYPQPCGNMTDSEKEQLRGGTKSECGRTRPKQKFYSDTMSAYSEKTFDKLYLKATSSCPKLKDVYDNNSVLNYSVSSKTNDFNLKNKFPMRSKKQKHNVKSVNVRHTLLVVEKDYEGSKAINTLTVCKGDVVILVQGSGIEADVDSEWFYIRNKDGAEGFIPASIAGYGYL